MTKLKDKFNIEVILKDENCIIFDLEDNLKKRRDSLYNPLNIADFLDDFPNDYFKRNSILSFSSGIFLEHISSGLISTRFDAITLGWERNPNIKMAKNGFDNIFYSKKYKEIIFMESKSSFKEKINFFKIFDDAINSLFSLKNKKGTFYNAKRHICIAKEDFIKYMGNNIQALDPLEKECYSQLKNAYTDLKNEYDSNLQIKDSIYKNFTSTIVITIPRYIWKSEIIEEINLKFEDLYKAYKFKKIKLYIILAEDKNIKQLDEEHLSFFYDNQEGFWNGE